MNGLRFRSARRVRVREYAIKMETRDTTHRRDGGIRAAERTTTVAGAAGDRPRPDFLRR